MIGVFATISAVTPAVVIPVTKVLTHTSLPLQQISRGTPVLLLSPLLCRFLVLVCGIWLVTDLRNIYATLQTVLLLLAVFLKHFSSQEC